MSTPPSAQSTKPIQISFEHGSILWEGLDQTDNEDSRIKYDPRIRQHRSLAQHYRNFVLELQNQGKSFEDHARAYKTLSLSLPQDLTPRDYQKQALQAWINGGGLGVVCLPTGAGKTVLAVLAIQKTQRSTLVCVPTIDLMLQWHSVLTKLLGGDIGRLGGGYKEWGDITVATYDSAALSMETHGNKIGFLIFDECHHLPAPQYQKIVLASIAPYRLGLTATPERPDGGEAILYDLVGPLVFRAEIREMAAKVLAPYDVISLEVDLSPEERDHYESTRAIYLNFVRKSGINFSQPGAWKEFIIRCSRSPEGRYAMKAFREQKQISQRASKKFEVLWSVLTKHAGEAAIIFTDDNATAYHVGTEFCLPVITHKTKALERKDLLQAFRDGVLKVMVTSKVLNEGVDVPEARIGIVISGSGTVREHVQRLGRILRQSPGKRAILYEIVAKNTNETYVNERRRKHDAYQRTP